MEMDQRKRYFDALNHKPSRILYSKNKLYVCAYYMKCFKTHLDIVMHVAYITTSLSPYFLSKTQRLFTLII